MIMKAEININRTLNFFDILKKKKSTVTAKCS